MTIRYARGRDKTDAHPEPRTAADFHEFAKAVLSDRCRRKGQQYICGPLNSELVNFVRVTVGAR